MSRVSVVIPAWNAEARIGACLAALTAQTHPADEIIIVDNGSVDATRAVAQQVVPAASLVVNPANTGFARAVNQGIVAASGDILVLLNDDTTADPGLLAGLSACLVNDTRCGAVAATMLFADRPDRVNSAGLTVGHDLVAFDGLWNQSTHRLPDTPWSVFGASGGAAAFRRAALDDVGLFDERFHSYYEDVDLAWRLRLRGWDAVATPSARVLHAYSASGGRDSAYKRYQLARNRVWCLVKNVPGDLWRRCWSAVLWYDWAALLAALIARDTAWLRGRRDGLLGLSHIWPARQSIQRRRTASVGELAALLGPRVGPLATWRARRLARLVAPIARRDDRASSEQ
jgi:GT2 family glycosyltransferase